MEIVARIGKAFEIGGMSTTMGLIAVSSVFICSAPVARYRTGSFFTIISFVVLQWLAGVLHMARRDGQEERQAADHAVRYRSLCENGTCTAGDPAGRLRVSGHMGRRTNVASGLPQRDRQVSPELAARAALVQQLASLSRNSERPLVR